ncbi:MAG: Methyltransferase type 11 [Candidatus Gottesmanbacteria bacterium GW2011_GWB1_43_11]|uniref:Methyltransferase type 11 n=1 Tax=Candidatus Gottesmanbacteria bacterium GW2011_GWB1_43_11 TaxID=1618446 RepID=A0A0G1CNX2_9BACT|nr:MAG: Methyltransferase type 11 [Candidatus Gottesmanbacteria bacterium GW2011_GWA2_42_16]KKS56263.1 MAG: Methyltransferase type 11 [Candidatus Gottesmanbacteria bacterium GW2011_GWA1_42_26]KKS82596.1 MAG: Methyltransferase type 11 [Candidatus Gottesmanbacteria bacterium GW2011_GWC1_43_10]KKS87465.1 MAG: Methyltransferase type 11 [Candidatus Gottesmanbacteria bacterium GW2011_GWB1_43_11]OGG10160.1 MAG: hypothetical protein A2699_01275 [Candidatus Gottesmanbacteria bacterium RIFCSPHIGHO2_01_FU
MKKTTIQIKAGEYNTLDYLDKPRWISLWQQIYEVNATHPKTVLEVGKGNGVVSHALQLLFRQVTTLDIDPELKPDYVGDVRKLPFKNTSFDTVLCAEVLEHIPFSDVTPALNELKRVTKKHVILTIPHDYLTYFWLTFKLIPFVKPQSWFFLVPRNQKHEFTGQHYWEIGKRGYPLAKIKRTIEESGFTIVKNYCLPENPYHRFFVLEAV